MVQYRHPLDVYTKGLDVMKQIAIKLIGLAAYLYALYNDFIAQSIWWFLADLIIIPLGTIRGFLMAFHII